MTSVLLAFCLYLSASPLCSKEATAVLQSVLWKCPWGTKLWMGKDMILCLTQVACKMWAVVTILMAQGLCGTRWFNTCEKKKNPEHTVSIREWLTSCFSHHHHYQGEVVEIFLEKTQCYCWAVKNKCCPSNCQP
jgi:hypothetical protein